MDVYQISVDLKPGIRDHQFVAALEGYLGHLKSDGKIESWRLLRRKLGLGLATLGEFQILIETRECLLQLLGLLIASLHELNCLLLDRLPFQPLGLLGISVETSH